MTGDLPPGFPTIDKFVPETGIATSIKTIDLEAATYRNPARLEKLLTGYIDKVAAFKGADWGGYPVREAAIVGRELLVAIPRKAVPEQQAVFSAMESYAQSHGVKLIVEVVR